MSAHTPTPWAYEEWATSGPTAAAAMTIEQAMRLNEFAVPMTRICQAKGTGKQVVAVALGNTQEEADANAARIVSVTNACAGMSDPEKTIAAYRAVADMHEIADAENEDLIRERDALRAERDGLREALSEIMAKEVLYERANAAKGKSDFAEWSALIDNANAALARSQQK